MKFIKHLFVFAFLSSALLACKNEKQPEVKTVEVEVEAEKPQLDPNATYAKAEFTIKGMTCEMGCAKTIEKKLAKMEGVKTATVDFEKELAMVEYDEAKVNTSSLTETVSKAGDTYTVEDMKTVDTFSTKEACSADCKKPCCADKTEKTEDKTACSKNCKKDCCKSKKGKA